MNTPDVSRCVSVMVWQPFWMDLGDLAARVQNQPFHFPTIHSVCYVLQLYPLNLCHQTSFLGALCHDVAIFLAGATSGPFHCVKCWGSLWSFSCNTIRVVEVEEGGVAEVAVLCVRCCSATPALPPCHPDVPDECCVQLFHALESLNDLLVSFVRIRS